MNAYEKYYIDKNKRLEDQIELLEGKIKSLMVIIEQGEELRAKAVVELCNERNKLNHENKSLRKGVERYKRSYVETRNRSIKFQEENNQLKWALNMCDPVQYNDHYGCMMCEFCERDAETINEIGHDKNCEYERLIGGDSNNGQT